MRRALVLISTSILLSSLVLAQSHSRARRSVATVCGNPLVACRTTVTFEPNDLPFRVAKDAVVIDTAPFYAIMLKSKAASLDTCDDFVPETERLAAQALFADHKVFTSRCPEPDNLRYEDITGRKFKSLSDDYRIMAVYAGATLREAQSFLKKVKATGKYPGANIRRLRSGFNGT